MVLSTSSSASVPTFPVVGRGSGSLFRFFQMIVGGPLGRRQEDMAVTLHLEERHPAAHLLQTPIGFFPVGLFTEHPGEMRTVEALGDEAPDELYIGSAEVASAILHDREYTQNALRVSSIILKVAITAPSPAPCSTEGPGARGRREDGAAHPLSATSGTVPSTAASGRASILASRRQMILMDVPLRLRKTKR